MSCGKTLNTGADCNGRCSQCGGSSAGTRGRPEALSRPGRPSFHAVLEAEARYPVAFVKEVEGESK